MRAKITAVAAIAASVFIINPSFGQMMAPAGAPPAAARPAAAPPAAAPSGPAMGRGAGNRQAWRGDGRRHAGYNRGYRGGYGGGVYFGAVPYYGGPYAYDDNDYVGEPVPAGGDVAYCMRRFKSYDPDSGTYLGFDGRRHPCP